MLGITLDDIARVEQVLGFSFPRAHRQDLERRDSEVREACEFLLVDGTEQRDLLKKNVWLRQNHWQGWTPRYIAFASNGCGDYFAYDLNFEPYRIIYVDPLETLEETAKEPSIDNVVFLSYDEWRADKIRTHKYVQE